MPGDANEGGDKKEDLTPLRIAKAWREAKAIYLKFAALFMVQHFVFLVPLIELKVTIGQR